MPHFYNENPSLTTQLDSLVTLTSNYLSGERITEATVSTDSDIFTVDAASSETYKDVAQTYIAQLDSIQP